MRLPIALALLITTITASAQTWTAGSLWDPRPVPVLQTHGRVTLPLPDLWRAPSMVSFLTTESPGEPYNLVGATLRARIQISGFGNPTVYFGTGGGRGTRGPNARIYFTTARGPYVLNTANAFSTNYWWADYAEAFFGIADMTGLGNATRLIPGTFDLTAPINPALWSDSQGHLASDPRYTAAFFDAARRAVQVGFSFGGGSFFDTGVGISNQKNRNARAVLAVLEFRIDRGDVPPNQWRRDEAD